MRAGFVVLRFLFVASDWSYYLAGWFMVGTYSFSKEIHVGMSGLKSKRRNNLGVCTFTSL